MLTAVAVVALLVVLVDYQRAIGMVGTIEETLVDKVAPGARDVAGHLAAHQRALVTAALGGISEEYTGRMMQPAHAGMAITHEAFD